jgi:hypothetical protein
MPADIAGKVTGGLCGPRKVPREGGPGITAFDTELSDHNNWLFRSWRSPQQMLHAQVYDSRASIHDGATGQAKSA